MKDLESKMFKKDYIERKLLGVILWQKTLQILDVENILKEIAEILKITTDVILEKVKNNKEDLIFEAEVFYASDVDLKKDVSELLDNLKEEYFKDELSNKMQELHQAEIKKEDEKSILILREINEINNKIQNIKSGRLTKK